MLHTPSRKILVVDASPGGADASKAVLQLRNHQVFTAPDGLAGFELALQESPDVVITDIELPGCSGFELAERLRLRTQFAGSVLFAVSLLNDNASLAHAQSSGFDFFAQKPVESEALIHGAEASRQGSLINLSQSLLERSRALQERCDKLSAASRRATQANAELRETLSSAFFLTPPQRLCSAVSQYAAKAGGFRRVCYVVVDFTRGRIEQVDSTFEKQTDARHHARRFGVHGYFYPLYERKGLQREFFPSARQVMNYLTKRMFDA